MPRSPRTSPEQLGKARIRSWVESKLLDGLDAGIHQAHGATKASAIGPMIGTVVEIGPGTGANMKYYGAGTGVIGVEPNPNMHDALREKASHHGVDVEIRTARAERLDVEESSADGVVGTLVLCGVDDPEAVVAEIHRVLKPGATYFFLEHVAADAGTNLRRVQDGVMRAHRWLAIGCEVNRDTGAIIEAAGFSSVDTHMFDPGLQGAYARPHLIGTATK